MNKKAVNPVVGVVVLLILVVVITGIAFYWKGFVSYHEGELFRQQTKVEILGTHYNVAGLNIFMKNSGDKLVPVQNRRNPPTTLWVVRDANYNIICSTTWAGSNGRESPSCESGCGPDAEISTSNNHDVKLKMMNTVCDPPKQDGEKVYYFTIDFSGVATGSGAFVKQ